MILVDTSVWADYFRVADLELAAFLQRSEVILHPFIIGELALGFLRARSQTLADLAAMPQATVASDAEVLALIETQQLAGMGIGYVDAHLLAAVRLTPETWLWTRDKRLGSVAHRLGLSVPV